MKTMILTSTITSFLISSSYAWGKGVDLNSNLEGLWVGNINLIEESPNTTESLKCEKFKFRIINSLGRLTLKFPKESYLCGEREYFFDDMEYTVLDGDVFQGTNKVGKAQDNLITINSKVCIQSDECETWEMVYLEYYENNFLDMKIQFDHDSSAYKITLDGQLIQPI